MPLNRNREEHSVRFSLDHVWLGDYQLSAVSVQVTYGKTGMLYIETFECEIHSTLPCASQPAIRLSAADVQLERKRNSAVDDPLERYQSLHIGHLRMQPLMTSQETTASPPSFVTDCRLDIVSYHYETAIYSEVLLTSETVKQQRHGLGCGLAYLEHLISTVLQIPVVTRDRNYESHLRAVKKQMATVMDNTAQSRTRNHKVTRQMASNLVKEICQLELQGQKVLSSSLLRRIPLMVLRLLLPLSDCSRSDDSRFIELLLMLHRIQPEKAVALLVSEMNIPVRDWRYLMDSPLLQLLSKHYASPMGGDIATQKQIQHDIARLLLDLSNRMLVESYLEADQVNTAVHFQAGVTGGLADLFSLIQIANPLIRCQRQETSELHQRIRQHVEQHRNSDDLLPVIEHYERLYQLTESPDVLVVLATLHQAGGYHLQRLEGLLFGQPENPDLTVLAKSNSALSVAHKEKAIRLLLCLSEGDRCSMIGEYFRHIKGQLPLKMRVLDAFSQQHSRAEQQRLMRLLPATVLAGMVTRYYLNTELSCIDRLLTHAAKATVQQRLCIAAILPIERLHEQVMAWRHSLPDNDSVGSVTTEQLKCAEKRLERMLDMASEFDADLVVRLCDRGDSALKTRIETRTRHGDVRAARQLTQRILTRLLTKGYRIASGSRTIGAFREYLAGLKQLYNRYRFWSYGLFSRLLQDGQEDRDPVNSSNSYSVARYGLHELPERDVKLFQLLQLAAKYCDQGMMLLNIVDRLHVEAMMAKKV